MEGIRQHLSIFKSKIQKTIPVPVKVKRFAHILKKFSIDFCDNSNIHGVRYFTARSLHWTERLWWIITVGLSLWWCGDMIQSVWMEWNENPTKSDTTMKTHISSFPFPTVTICPRNRNVVHKLNITSKFENNKLISNLSQIEVAQLDAFAHICPGSLPIEGINKNDFSNESFYDIIGEVAPNVEYALNKCKWHQKRVKCLDYISRVFTMYGLCYTFNTIDIYTQGVVQHRIEGNRNLSGWSLQEGYNSKKFTESEYPFRAFDSGQRGALELVFNTYVHDFDLMCNEKKRGFFYFIHEPGEVVAWQTMRMLDYSDDMTIALWPGIKAMSSVIRNYAPKQRRCFSRFERQLHFFKMYTFQNCHVECLANFTRKQCGCVPYHMPRDANTKICGEAKIKCYNDAFFEQFRGNRSMICNCWENCETIDYSSTFDERSKYIERAAKRQKNVTDLVRTKLTIYFGQTEFGVDTKVETYTWTDFLAICGGLLGVFVGVSFLSVIEIIYYSSLRLFWIVYRSELNEEQADKNEVDTIDVYGNVRTNQNQMIERMLRLMSFIRAIFTGYSDISNIHGVRYFSERALHWSERLMWLIAFGVSLSLCGLMIQNIWIKWADDPATFIYMKSFHFEKGKAETSVNISHPTVTICPDIKYNINVNATLNSSPSLSGIEMAQLNALAHVCPVLPQMVKFNDNFTEESVYTLIQDMANLSQFTNTKCKWDRPIPCTELFTPVFTEEGLCLSFNALNSRDIYTDEMAPGMMIVKNNPNISGWSFVGRYTNFSDDNYPYRSFYKDRRILVVRLEISERNIRCDMCKGCDMGFKVMINVPGETVDTAQKFIKLRMSDETIMRLFPKMTITSQGLRGYTPNKRQCYYNYENPLRFFKIYTKPNCKAECVANFTKIECGCVKFSMPSVQ